MKRRIHTILVCVGFMINSLAYTSSDVYAYISKYKDIALRNEREYGIPATIILAQGILESGAGTSSLTRSSNNHFGIKAFGWNGAVVKAWDDEPEKSRFRSYTSAEESFRDHARLLTTKSNYRNLFGISIYDYRRWAHGLKKAGYATAPNYAQALIGIIDQYKLYNINGGAKLRPGKTVVITRYEERSVNMTQEVPVFSEECVMEEEESSEEQEMIEEAQHVYAVNINNTHCTVIQPGDDLAGISRKYDISISDLMQFNEVTTKNQLKEGDIVFLTKKKKKYEGARDFYIARADDTLHSISQQFGIQLGKLADINGLPMFGKIKEGMRIRLK